ncbi:MAG: hypothetical protein HY342_12750 [Candidatus Lambdaproteobacteria bacterium]|nr:hypothetical protein [Candidatus Lambdaproteobacteria bacterium]
MLAALLLVLALGGPAAWGQAPELPGLDRLARPAQDMSLAQIEDPTWGFRFGIGLQYLSVSSSQLHVSFAEGAPFSDGALIVLEAVLRNTRVAFARRIYRQPLPTGTTLQGDTLTFMGIESDQFWVFQGLHPVPTLYLGAGVGWESRRYSFLLERGGAPVRRDQAVLKAGLLVDYMFADPFSLQVRSTTEEPGRLVQITGTTLVLAYHIPF